MAGTRVARASVALFGALTLACAAGPLTTSADSAEVDSAVLSYNPSVGGWNCTFSSPDEGLGACTVQTVSLGATCFGVSPPVRSGSVVLIEPAGEGVVLHATVVGGANDGTFAATGTDGVGAATGGGTFSESCAVDRASAFQVTVSWVVG